MLRFKGFNQLLGGDVLSTQDISGNACRVGEKCNKWAISGQSFKEWDKTIRKKLRIK